MLFVCYIPKIPEHFKPNRANRDLWTCCSVSSRYTSCSVSVWSRGLMGCSVLVSVSLEHQKPCSVHLQAWLYIMLDIMPYITLYIFMLYILLYITLHIKSHIIQYIVLHI